MNSSLDTRRIGIFLLLTFGIAWAIALVIYLNGGLYSNLVVPALGNQPFALVLFNFVFLFAPMLANLITRVITREGWADIYLWPQFRRSLRYIAAAWVLPAVLTIAGAAIYFVLFLNSFDAGLSQVKQAIAQSEQGAAVDPWSVVLFQILSFVLVSPLLFAAFTFGEEFGWRGYLLPKLLPLGARRAAPLQGLVWGVWYAPMLAMGYEYGLSYPGAPWLGMLAFLIFSISSGTFLAWVAVRGGSVWPAVIGRAAINGIATISILALLGSPDPILGPYPTGVIGGLGWVIFAAILIFIPRLWQGATLIPDPSPYPGGREKIST